MAITRGVRQLVAEADAAVKTVTVAAALERQEAGALIVDLRDIRERAREGFIPGSFHAPRGMIEFWVDPDSPYFKETFGEEREFIFHCASGWRSALATKAVQDMGLAPRLPHRRRIHGLEEGRCACAADGGRPGTESLTVRQRFLSLCARSKPTRKMLVLLTSASTALSAKGQRRGAKRPGHDPG